MNWLHGTSNKVVRPDWFPAPFICRGVKKGYSHFYVFSRCTFYFRNSLLSQYRFCTAGIGLGTAYALRYKKGVIPMLAAGAIGTSADMVYGYLVECAAFRDTNGSSESGSAGATVVSSSIPQSKNTSPTASSGNSTT